MSLPDIVLKRRRLDISSGRRIPPPAADELAAGAACQADRVVIENRESDLWMDVKIEVNRDFRFIADAIPPKETMRYYASIFTKSDGTRLDLSRIACLSIDIHATVNGKRRHANFAKRQ